MANKKEKDIKISSLFSIVGNPFEEIKELAKSEKCPFDRKEYKRIRERQKQSNTYIEIEHSKDDYCYISAIEYKYVLPRLVALYWGYKKGKIGKRVIRNLIDTVLLMGEAEGREDAKFREEFIEKIKEILRELELLG